MEVKKTIIDKLKEKNKEWIEERPMAGGTGPWSFMSLKPSYKEDEFWLNPYNQDYVPYGHFSEKDLEKWLNEDDSFLIKGHTFTELKEYCEVGYLSGHHYNKELKMNHYPPKYADMFSKKALKNLLSVDNLTKTYYEPKRKFNKFMIEELEGHIKSMLIDYFKYSSTKNLIENCFTINKEYQNKIHYFLQGLSNVGIGYWAYSNTPAERENFSYYQNFLVHELCKEIYSTRRIRKYEEYIIDINVKENKWSYDLFYNDHRFPYTFMCEDNISSFDELFEKSKMLIDSKEAKKVLTFFKKEPLKVQLSALHKTLEGIK